MKYHDGHELSFSHLFAMEKGYFKRHDKRAGLRYLKSIVLIKIYA